MPRSESFAAPVSEETVLANTARELLLSTELDGARIRLLGITVSNFAGKVNSKSVASSQLPLFDAR